MATSQLNGFLRRVRTITLLQEASGLTDAQPLDSFVNRKDEASFEALVQRHGPMGLGSVPPDCRAARRGVPNRMRARIYQTASEGEAGGGSALC